MAQREHKPQARIFSLIQNNWIVLYFFLSFFYLLLDTIKIQRKREKFQQENLKQYLWTNSNALYLSLAKSR